MNGRREPIGKRALDILSVLAEANGGIVTKDELLEAVWPGVTVEENALQVHIVALRKALGPEADRLQTIRGVGYQLDVGGLPAAPEPERQVPRPEPQVPSPGESIAADRMPNTSSNPVARLYSADGVPDHRFRRGRLAWVLGGATIAIAALFGVAALLIPGEPPTGSQEIVRVDTLRATGGSAAQTLALTLDGDILDVFNQARIQTGGNERNGFFSRAPKANRVLRGTVTQIGERLKVQIYLEDLASGTTLWTRQFERDAEEADRLATEASVAAARTIHTIVQLGSQRQLRLDPETIALHIQGNELLRVNQPFQEGAPRRIFEQIVARAPKSAHGHGLLALTLAGEATRAPPEEAATLIAQAKSEAAKAIALDPAAAGPAFDALYGMSLREKSGRFAEIEDELLASLRQAPEFAFLVMRECRLLTDMGRARAALVYCQRALALHPFAEPIVHSYANALNVAGNERAAQEAIERAYLYSPEASLIRYNRFALAAFGGRPDDARRLLADPETAPDLSRQEAALLDRYLAGHGEWSTQQRSELTKAIVDLDRDDDLDVELGVLLLTSLGRNDEALELLGRREAAWRLFVRGSGFLFQPATASLRADPRFWGLAADLGLARYWAQRGQWPDVCGREFTLEFCKSQTAKALSRR